MGSVILALKLTTPICRMLFLALCAIIAFVSAEPGTNKTGVLEGAKALSVFNVVSFPNSACGATSGYNGTCYTATECSSMGGTASGTCASSFGVCCVFSISCGSSSSANNTYAIISSYSTSTDPDPCTYKFCKTNSDVCKLRIDFENIVLEGPAGLSSPHALTDGLNVGDCSVDSLTVTNPGGASPPVICGYNTGQHMWVPASDMCNTINIDIDTGTTTTTRKWQIKVTQYECGNMMMPVNNCLQYHTAMTGSIATFNWDTSAGTVNANYRICGAIFSADPATIATTASVCSFSTPFKIGVHFDEDESIAADPDEAKAPNLNKAENDPLA